MREAMARASSHIWAGSVTVQASQRSWALRWRMRAKHAAGTGCRTSGSHSSPLPVMVPSMGLCDSHAAVDGAIAAGEGPWVLRAALNQEDGRRAEPLFTGRFQSPVEGTAYGWPQWLTFC